MDACKYCRGYHNFGVVCQEYIDALAAGKIKLPEPCEEKDEEVSND